MENSYIMIFVTTKDKEEAEKITEALLNKHLIACGNIVFPVTSLFYWLGNVDRVEECLVVMKSRLDLFGQVAESVRDLHSYEVPEVLAVPIIGGSKDYFDWMDLVLKQAK